MTNHTLFAVASLAVAIALNFPSGSRAGQAPAAAAETGSRADRVSVHVVTDDDIGLKIDGRASQREADRAAIQALLRDPRVRRIAGSAGLDLERAQVGAATLSGPSLADLASRARELNQRIAGGGYVVISTTAIIIVLLLLILLTR